MAAREDLRIDEPVTAEDVLYRLSLMADRSSGLPEVRKDLNWAIAAVHDELLDCWDEVPLDLVADTLRDNWEDLQENWAAEEK